MTHDETPSNDNDDCVVHSHPVPPEVLGRYSPERDPHNERDIKNYVHGQAPDELVQHVERVKREVVLGELYEIWDVTTDRDRWWVITNLTNLYSQQHFPSLDYTLSFHIGLMRRLRSGLGGADIADPSPFDDVLRRMDQASERLGLATETEDFQAVGMQLRECLVSLVGALRRRVEITVGSEHPKDSDVVSWLDLLHDALCPGGANKELRRHLKSAAKSAWQLVNWLTHDRNANKSVSLIVLEACNAVVGNSVVILERSRTDATDQCPSCNSRQIRTHFDIGIGSDGDYYVSCASCHWTTHPGDS